MPEGAHIKIGSPGAFTTVIPVAIPEYPTLIAHTLTSMQHGLILQNVGANECWYGDDNIDPTSSRGCILIPRMMIILDNVRQGFTIYFTCASGLSTNIGVIEITP